MATFQMPERLVTGPGSVAEAGRLARSLGRRPLVVTGPGAAASGRAARLARLLEAEGLEPTLYAGIGGEPDVQMVTTGLDLLRRSACDMLVGFGGGSPLDAAKAIALLATNPGRLPDYMGHDRVQNPTLPLLAIPTTAGTGSEVTRFTVITDETAGVKMLIGSPYLIPRIALVDPTLTHSCPPTVTADVGLDALTHAIEAYVSRRAQPLTDTLALSAIGRLSRHLPTAWAEPDCAQAREQVMLGALEAGLAFSNASVALVHGMSRPLGAQFQIPHGRANAILLPGIMRWSLPAAPHRYGEIARAMGLQSAEEGAEAVAALCRDLAIPSLAEAGVDPQELIERAQQMAADALASGSPANNPRVPTQAEIVALYLAHRPE